MFCYSVLEMPPKMEKICNLKKSSSQLVLKSNDSLSSTFFEGDILFVAD